MNPNLTPRQKEIISLKARGLMERQIADRLYISLDTVKTHLQTSYSRLGAINAPHAVYLAMKGGLLN